MLSIFLLSAATVKIEFGTDFRCTSLCRPLAISQVWTSVGTAASRTSRCSSMDHFLLSNRFVDMDPCRVPVRSYSQRVE